jgi:hypothetical protein
MGGSADNDDQSRRNHVYAKLVEFYEQRDPSKVGRLNDFVQYIMLHGIEAFNRKLYAKYGAGIVLDPKVSVVLTKQAHEQRSSVGSMGSSFTISSLQSSQQHGQHTLGGGGSSNDSDSGNTGKDIPTSPRGGSPPAAAKKQPPPAPPAKKQPPAAPSRAAKKEEPLPPAPADSEDDDLEIDMDLLPPPPPPGDEPSKAPPSVKALREKLTKYYSLYDAGKLEHVESILEWGMQIGEDELESKLNMIYGYSFADAMAASQPKTVAQKLRASLGSLAPSKAPAAAPQAAKKQPPAVPPLPPPAGGAARAPAAGARAPAAAHAPATRQPAASVASEADGGPCSLYELDMSGSSFGVCRCGYSRLAHTKGSPEYKKATSNKKNAAQVIASEVRGAQFAPAKTGSKQQQPAAVQQQQQQQRQQPVPEPAAPPGPHVDHRAGAGEKGGDGPCGQFQLDMAAGSFAVCECGYKRDQHGGVVSNIKRMSKKLMGR